MITERIFGEIKGISINEVTIHNKAGMEVSILSYGATIRSVIVPTANGKKIDVCLGYDTIEEYMANGGFFGASVGRFANRIKGAAFDLDGKHYTLAANEAPNHLHGGIQGWSKKIWNYTTNPDNNSEDNRMVIEYSAVTDKATPINMTNHWYINLNGHASGDIMDHTLQLNAEGYTETDDKLIPTGKIISVEGTPYDFRTPKAIRTDFDAVRVLPTSGYDNNFVLGKPGEFKQAAVLKGDKSGLTMTAYTNMEGMQLYTGNHIHDRKGKANTEYHDMSGLCMEPHHFPDCVNKPEFPSAIVRPGETYYHHTEFKFEG